MKRLGILLALVPAFAADAGDDVQKVIDCMRANVPSYLTIENLELTTFDRVGGSRTLKGRLFTARDSGDGGLMNASLRIDAPAELKGAAYLMRETSDYLRDGMFVYLPAVKRVRRITGTFADGALLGTNFSYFDFKQMQNAFGDLSAATLETPEHINGRSTNVLRFQPLAGSETRYTSVRTWIDQQACVAVRAEFHEGKKVAKQLTTPAGSVKQAGQTWYVSEIEMRDPGAGTRTVLRLAKLDTDKEPPRRYFDQTSFYLGP